MALQGISGAYASQASLPAAKLKQEIADQSFATLLNTGSEKKPDGTPLKVLAIQPASDVTETKSSSSEAVKEKEKTPAELFLEYMNKTPEQRWKEAWLKQHGLTEKEFEALSAEKKQALMDQMAQDMKEQVRQTAEKKAVVASAV